MKTFRVVLLGLVALAVGGALSAQVPQAKAKVTAEEEKMGTIEGYEIPRKAGGYLGLQVVDGNFQITFYDVKKKPVAMDVARGTARWNPPQKTGSAFCVLNPSGDGKSLVGNKFVRPPLNFIVFITLLNAKGEATETYPVNLMK